MNRHPQSEIIWQTLRNEKCRACSLHKEAQSVCLLGDGPVPSQGMIIGEAPGFREDSVQIPFSGKSGIFLRQQLKSIGFDPRTMFITNVAACRPPNNRTPTRSEAKTCAGLYLAKQIEMVKPKAILLLGNVAVQFATGKKATVTKMEGSTFTLDDCPQLLPSIPFGIVCVPSRHPSSVLRAEGEPEYPFLLQKFRENLMLFKRILQPPEDDESWFTREPIELNPEIPYAYTDIETNGLNPYREEAVMHSTGFAQYRDRVTCFKLEKKHTSYVRETLKKYPIIAHRATFEGIWYLQKYGITPRIYHDTKLCAYMRDENQPTGLKHQAMRLLSVEPWDEGQDWQNPDFNKLLPYEARDISYGLRLYLEHDLPFLRKNPKIAKLMRHILLPAMEVFTEIIHNGFHIDVKAAKKKIKHCQREKSKLNNELNTFADQEVNPGSPKQMARLLYTQLRLTCPVKTAKGKDSTAEPALIRLKGQHRATDALWEWRGWDKYESTYLEPWLRQGPILHALYDFTGTDTGRLSSSMIKNSRKEKGTGAVIHQCPRDPFIRNLVVPRNPGWRIVACDESQGELRLVAHAANEPTMIDIFHHDSETPEGDIHFQTARTLQPEGEIIKETRKKAKAVNFGFVYGMMAKKFAAYALEKFDVRLSGKEAFDYRTKFFTKYSGLLPWHRRVEAFVIENGHIDSILGRRRHLPEAKHRDSEDCPNCFGKKGDVSCFHCGGEGYITSGAYDEWVQREAVRQAINSPIQSACSDILLFVMALIASYSLDWDFKIDRKRTLPIGSAHDSGLFETHPDYASELRRGILWTMKNLPLKKFFNIEMRCPIVMDCNIYEREWEGKKILCA